MRKRLIAGNWKMNLHWNEAMTLISDLVQMEHLDAWKSVDVAIIPPAIYLRPAYEFLKNANSSIQLGSQNCASMENGAYTGEVSASMIREIGVNMVLIGHSERRDYFLEDDGFLKGKLKLALKEGLTPIFCCGEHLDNRESGLHEETILSQLVGTIFKFSSEDVKKMIIAYEPVWAIGTGETATPEQAQEMHAFIRNAIRLKFGNEVAENIRILYGGSMNPENAGELLFQPDVDGGLIGGAAIDAEKFNAIITA